jgi:squalene-associated FAD-dependent desaturase
VARAVKADVLVVGAGFAGLSAAVRLADAGRRVIVLEEGPRLGGRATAFTDRETGERVDNGQHVLFGCYHETYAFLRAIGAADRAPLQSRLSLSMTDDSGRRSTLVCPPWPAPWHLVGGVLRWSALPVSDRLQARHLRPLLLDIQRVGAKAVAARVPASMTVSQWLDANRQTRALRDWLWDPLAYAALNQPPEVAAAAPFVRVVGELFGPRPEDAAVGLPNVPLDELYAAPAAAYLQSRGSEVRLKSSARVIVRDGTRVAGVDVGGELIDAPVVVSAVPWHAFGRLFRDGIPAPIETTAARASAMTSSPIVTVNLWYDGPVLDAPFVGLVRGPMHWVFDKSAIFGSGAGHLSIVASGARDLAAMPNDAVTAAAVSQLAQSLPATRGRRVVRSVVVREQRATFSLAPGEPARPGTVTPVEGLYLAGDWTDTGLPATIEGAVRSGHAAADAVAEAAR